MSCSRCSETARPASSCASRRCCSAPASQRPARAGARAAQHPFVKFGGLKFVETAHVKDLLAFLRLAENPRDRVAAFRVLQLLPGIGPGTARRALALLEAGNFDFAALGEMQPPAASASCGRSWSSSCALWRGASSGSASSNRCAPSTILCSRSCTITHARLADLDELCRIAATYPSRERFLTELTLDPPAAAGGEAGVPLRDEDYLILSTIRPRAGWRAVYVLNVVDGCIPSDMATGSSAEIEEERRVLYVAMTRARDQLHLIHPHRFAVGGQPSLGDRYVHAPRSRFSRPAGRPVRSPRARLRCCRGGRGEPRSALPRVDVGALLVDMWR